MANALTVNNQILFTTYVPTGSAEECAASVGSGRIYVLSVFDGRPVMNLYEKVQDTGVLSTEDRFVELELSGIPSEVLAIFSENKDPSIIVGPEKGPPIDFGELTRRVYWTENND